MEEDSPDLIWLGDKLPAIYEATIHIHYLSPTATAEIRDTVIHQYASSLHDLWVCSFGSEYAKLCKTIPQILYRIMAEYDKYCKTHLYGNAKQGIPTTPIFRVNRDWFNYCVANSAELTCIQEKGHPSKNKAALPLISPNHVLNQSGLLDIGLNTGNLTGPESIFYKDQNENRKFCVSAEIDEQYEEAHQAEIEKHLAAEDEYMNETISNPVEFTGEFSTTSTADRREHYMKHSLQLSFSINQSDQECQDENDLPFSRPSIRNIWNVNKNVKNTTATVSYRCAVSIPKACIALQTVCDKMYGHKYYLTPEEQEQFEPSNETQSEQPKSKKA